ncbi:MAG: ribosomal protein [Parcubacteria group bacterium]|nr:ribosomal protein [Parcubacteria group bacterium]
MKIGPQYKIAKRLGASVFPKTQSQKFALAEERSAKNKRSGGRRNQTEFGKQLLEKQKVRMTYGISERQFSAYVRAAVATHGAIPTEVLHRNLELRLDNVMYRLGVAPSRRGARQMVSHGHITVNGVKTTIPSRAMRPGDKIAVRDGSKSAGLFENFAEKFNERPTLPAWLSWNAKSMEGSLQEVPTMESAQPAGDLVTVLSFYSR